MELEKQVCSLDLAKRLKELGVKQESLFWWNYIQAHAGYELDNDKGGSEYISAFTVAELGMLLPQGLVSGRGWNETPKTACCHWYKPDITGRPAQEDTYIQHAPAPDLPPQFADTEADARAKMLIYLLENKLITL